MLPTISPRFSRRTEKPDGDRKTGSPKSQRDVSFKSEANEDRETFRSEAFVGYHRPQG